MDERKEPSYFMDLALAEASRALSHGDVPIAALCEKDGEIISLRHNEKELQGDPTRHAEMLAIQDAVRTLGTKYLTGVTVYSTLEPCPMCAGALVLTRCERIVFASLDPKAGAASSLYNLCCDPRLNFELEVVSGVRNEQSARLLREFFASRR